MKLERLEYVGIVVDDLEVGVQRFSELFGLEFEIYDTEELDVRASDGVVPDEKAPQAGMRIAIDTLGAFELVEAAGAEEGFRNIHLRVDDMDAAIDHLSSQGLRLVRHFFVGDTREAIFLGDDLYGLRVCLLQYQGSSLGAAMARSRGSS